MQRECEIEIRVRFSETDAMGRVHHANFFNYFEIGRVELLRVNGWSYREIEESGLHLVVAQISCRYHLPAVYDDLLRLKTVHQRARGATIDHEYELYRGRELLVQGESKVACVDHEGRVKRLPEWLRLD